MESIWFLAGLIAGAGLGLVLAWRARGERAGAPYLILESDVRGRRAGEPLPRRYYWRAAARGEITPPAWVPTPDEMDILVAWRRTERDAREDRT